MRRSNSQLGKSLSLLKYFIIFVNLLSPQPVSARVVFDDIVVNSVTSSTTHAPTSGMVRFARTDEIHWRNQANNADLILGVNSSNQLNYNGLVIPSPASGTFVDNGFFIYDNGDATKQIAFEASGIATSTTRTITMPDANVNLGALTNVNIAAAAGISRSKLATGSLNRLVVNDGSTGAETDAATITAARALISDANGIPTHSTVTSTELGLLSGLTGTVVTSNNFATSLTALTNANISASAGISRTKIATSAASQVLINDSSGTMTSEASLAVSRGGTGLASGTSGGVLAYTATGTLASSGALTASQLIIGGGAGVAPSSLAAGSQYQVLRMGASNPAYGQINLDQGAAVTGTLPATLGGTGKAGYTIGDVLAANSSTSLTNINAGTIGWVLTSNGAGVLPTWQAAGGVATPVQNALVDSAFDYWQVGTSKTIANTVSTYVADQWYAKNSLGTNGVITFSQVTGVTNGSQFGASVKITTAPTAAQANGTELYQPLSNLASYPLYNQTASFTILIKALGNVNQIGCQFYYATSEVKLTTSIGSEQTATVNSSTFSSCTITAQALGTSQTVSGIVGVRIRITGVSSGNTYDLNNGFVAEQAMLNLGSTAGAFSRQFNDPTKELQSCEYFFQKSYETTTAPATVTSTGRVGIVGMFNSATVLGNGGVTINFHTPMRANPTVTSYSPSSGTSGHLDYTKAGNAAADVACSVAGTSTRAFTISTSNASGATAGQAGEMLFQFQADARM